MSDLRATSISVNRGSADKVIGQSAPLLTFHCGTLELHGVTPAHTISLPQSCQWDHRTACLRAPALAYVDVVTALRRSEITYSDQAHQYQTLPEGARIHSEPRPYQTEAMNAWLTQRGRGVVVLPTGAGKTLVALMAIDAKRRSTLVVVPTLELVRQWYDTLRFRFAIPVGIIGGGAYNIKPLTVTTYDSAYVHMEHLGAQFGLVIFDECHHLPSPSYALAAQFCLAPYRLGLTATPERADGREAALNDLVGPVVYRKDIVELSGDYLAEYRTERIIVTLSPEEWQEYQQERAIYVGFVRHQGIKLSGPEAWMQFIIRAARSNEGRRALTAYRRQHELALTAPAKLHCVEHLLLKHRQDRIILFTEDNATAYRVSRRFLIPTITHQTKVPERSEILEKFSQGTYGAVATSKVLNEGVDVPAANVAIVISGSGSIREHVQRLGRILRKQDGKQAILYELVTARTAETFTSARRREHSAYR